MLNLEESVTKPDDSGFFLTGLNLQNKHVMNEAVVKAEVLEPVDAEAEAIERYKLIAVIDTPRTISKTDVSDETFNECSAYS